MNNLLEMKLQGFHKLVPPGVPLITHLAMSGLPRMSRKTPRNHPCTTCSPNTFSNGSKS